ncbi:unnamed protein product [Dracunculus medinensis]|uniref:Thioredoxin domain-containing protein n=1 Tax=Dracunculus medinensis TaxID=318479 RepID=A0A0N4UJB4_DRAME|nr:unnamed protein product [Dracunculus medinensis]
MSLLPGLLLFSVAIAGTTAAPSRGYGDDIKWVTLDEAFRQAIDEQKPIFYLIHDSSCSACIKLKQKLSEAPEREDIVNLSREFVMVNMENSEVLKDDLPEYRPDGRYTPRILFLYPDGTLMTDVTNRKRSKYYSYYYDYPEDILEGMQKALSMMG